MNRKTPRYKWPVVILLVLAGSLLSVSSAFAQGSIFGSVTNSDATTPANGQIGFFGYLDDTDEEIRIEICTGAGYDAGNWYDDFQNYLTEAPGNPYDYHFHNSSNGEGYVLSKLIPNNSFQQEDITLASVSWPSAPANLITVTAANGTVIVSWTGVSGLTYHVYRRAATSNGSFFRVDDTGGSLSNPGVSDSFYVDNTVDGTSSYQYLVIAEDGSGNLSPHSALVTANSSVLDAPVLASVDPDTGFSNGGETISFHGSGFDPAGVNVHFGDSTVSGTVVSPFHVTAVTPLYSVGAVDVYVTNVASTLNSNTLTGGFSFVGNSGPIVDNIPDQSVPEGSTFTTISLDDYVADPNNSDDELTWTYSGNSELTVDITDRVATISIPGVNWNGSETITFRATDPGALYDEDAAIFAVTGVNDVPVVTDIPGQIIAEGASFTTINLDDYVSDIESDDSLLNWTYSGNSELSVSIDANRVATIGMPTTDWYGTETITFRAADDSAAYDEDAAVFTVTNINDAPVVADIPDQIIAEGSTFTSINLDDYVDDIDDADSTIDWTYSGNSELTVDITDRVATITIPNIDWNGAESITFRATDDTLAFDEDAATFTVTSINDAPVVADIPNQAIVEGGTFTAINLDDYVADVDHADSTIDWTYSGNTELTVDITDRVATITMPSPDWNGSEIITFRATDDSLAFAEDAATFSASADNDPPVVADIPDQIIAEGSTFTTINLDDYVTDIDNDDSTIVWTYVGNSELSVDITARVATISIPTVDWNGSETITFTATDPGALSDFDDATFIVTGINDAPVVADIPDQIITEGGAFTTINLDDYVDDIDDADSTIDWTYSGNSELTVDITDRVATITIPNIDWNGAESITFRATDDTLAFDEDAATFTVTSINDAPVVADIPNQAIVEGGAFTAINLDDYVADIDNPDSTLVWTYSGNTELTVDITDRVATITMPSPDWNGSEIITFRATDDSLAFAEDAATFSASADNDPPVVADIPDQIIAEGSTFTTINLDDYVTDIDNDDSTLAWTFSGNVNLDVSIDVNRVATITALNPDWNGFETIVFRATDPGTLFDEDTAVFTITGVNDAPVVDDIPDQVITEGGAFTAINLDDYVADIDNPDSALVWTYSGNIELTVDITDRVATITMPSPDWNGSEIITFRATDDSLAFAEDAATFSASADNDPPVVAGLLDETIAEDSFFTTINLDDYVTDIDNDDSTMTWTFSGNVNLDVSIDINRVATITALDLDWNGSETIVFIATDPGLLSGEDTAVFTVTGINDAPVVDDIPDETIPDGGTFAAINLDDYVSDVDNPDSTIDWTYSGNIELVVDIDSNRVVTITAPDVEWTGFETITFTATDDSLASAQDAATFTVTTENDPPDVAGIPDQTIEEGGSFISIVLDDYVTDLDNDDSTLTWTYSGNIDLIVNIDTNRVATVITPYADWFGAENIIFRATDPGALYDADTAVFTVNPGADAPVLDSIGPKFVMETFTLTFTITASDPDLTIPQLFADSIPLNATFADSGDGSGVFEFSPDITQSGVYTVLFYASDGTQADSEYVQIVVNELGNQPPIWDPVDPQLVLEGGTMSFTVSAIDPEDEGLQLFVNTELDNYIFVDSGNGTGLFTFDPDFYQSGVETVQFIALDGGDPQMSDVLPVEITILDVNQPPEIDSVGPQAVLLGDSLVLHITASDSTDPDGGRLYLSALKKPLNSTFVDSATNAALFVFTPDASQVGEDTLKVICFDDEHPALSDVKIIPITIVITNQAPILDPIGPQTVIEMDILQFNITATDIDGPSLSLFVDTLPLNATFVDSGNGVGTFTFAPDFQQSGLKQVTFYAYDGILTDYENVFIQVYDNPQPPEITIPPDTNVVEGNHLEVNITAIDPDLTTPEIILDNPVINVTFNDWGNGSSTFQFDPEYVQAGIYDFLFIATDGVMADSGILRVEVIEAGNQTPVLTAPDTVLGTELDLIEFTVYVSDADSVLPALTATGLPFTATFTDNGDFSGTFSWDTENLNNGTYPVWIYAEDGDNPAVMDSALVIVEVADYNYPPSKLFVHEVLPDSSTFPVGITSVAIDEDDSLVLRIESADPDSVPCILSVAIYDTATTSYSDIPAGALFEDFDDGLGRFHWKPDFYESGVYVFRFLAIDRNTLSDSLVRDVTVTVGDLPQFPVIDTVLPISTTEGDTFYTEITYSDLDSPPPTLFADSLPENTAIYDLGDDYVRMFVFLPYYDQAGNYTVVFRVVDNTGRADTMVVPIEVLEAGPQPPILDVPLASNITLRLSDSLVVHVTAMDPDATIPSMRLEGSPIPPTGIAFVDSANGGASFYYKPEAAHVGFTYELDFIASDGALEDTVHVSVDVVSYLCGDANNDEAVNVSDAVYIINYIFTGGSPPTPLMAADTNGSGGVNVSDAVYLINYIFTGGPEPICEGKL